MECTKGINSKVLHKISERLHGELGTVMFMASHSPFWRVVSD